MEIPNPFSSNSITPWSAKVPFRLVQGNSETDNIWFATPILQPGWYSIAVAYVINETPIWMGDPIDLCAQMNFNTENSHEYEETTPARLTSHFRKLGTDAGGNVIPITYPWPWGAHLDIFHTDAIGDAHYSLGIATGGVLGETVGGWIYVLLKRED